MKRWILKDVMRWEMMDNEIRADVSMAVEEVRGTTGMIASTIGFSIRNNKLYAKGGSSNLANKGKAKEIKKEMLEQDFWYQWKVEEVTCKSKTKDKIRINVLFENKEGKRLTCFFDYLLKDEVFAYEEANYATVFPKETREQIQKIAEETYQKNRLRLLLNG